MSLKAKLEAVIYAAEEPVTLTQLASLFAADALEWKAAQAAAAAEQTAEVAGEPVRADLPLPLLAEGLEYLGLADTPAVYAEAQAAAGQDAAPAGGPAAGAATDGEETAGSVGGAGAPSAEAGEPARGDQPGLQFGIDGEVAEGSSGQSVGDGDEAPAIAAPADIEAEARRLARLRDREVKAVLRHLLDELMASYSSDGRGVEIREIAGGYRMATKPECHDAVRLFVKSLKPAMKLSLPALETLAVIAYKQPVTAPEVNEIRGVESAGVLGSLLARKLIATAGRKQVIGRPILYKTTREFLLRFGLKDVAELPSMEEFEKMAAIEMEEMEPEATEADRSAAEAEVEESAELDLDSNSPSGVELAGTAESIEGAEVPAIEEFADRPRNEEPGETDTDAGAAPAAEPPLVASAVADPKESVPAEPDSTQQAETEAFPHGKENQEER